MKGKTKTIDISFSILFLEDVRVCLLTLLFSGNWDRKTIFYVQKIRQFDVITQVASRVVMTALHSRICHNNTVGQLTHKKEGKEKNI